MVVALLTTMSIVVPLLFPYKPRGLDNILKNKIPLVPARRKPHCSYTISARNVFHHFEIFPGTVKRRQL